jgi:glucan biosynthesis protein C
MVPPATTKRYHEMDSLRAGAMLLGLLYHVLFSFQTQTWGYYAHDLNNGYAANFVMAVIHGFRMELFFLIGGFFGHLVYTRYGLRGFIKNRSRRILFPFVVAASLLVVVDHVLKRYALHVGTIGRDYPNVDGWPAQPFYLWFLYDMSMLDVCTLTALVTLRGRVGTWLHTALQTAFAWLIKWPLKLLVLIIPVVAIEMTEPRWQFFDYVPVPGWLAYYAVFFGFGWLLYAHDHLLASLVPQRWFHLGVAVTAFGAWLALSQLAGEPSVGVVVAQRATLAFYAWAMIFALIGLAVRHLSSPSPTVRYLADSSYWLYLSHYPLVMFLQISVAPIDIWGPVKALGLFALVLGVGLTTYRYCVRYTKVGAVLNGPRARPVLASSAAIEA